MTGLLACKGVVDSEQATGGVVVLNAKDKARDHYSAQVCNPTTTNDQA